MGAGKILLKFMMAWLLVNVKMDITKISLVLHFPITTTTKNTFLLRNIPNQPI